MKAIFQSVLKILLLPALVVMFTGAIAHGQDIIVQKNGEEIKAKVEQVLDTEIRYRKFDNLGGPQYVIKKAEVFMIKYENGSKDLFTTEPAPVLPQPKPSPSSKVIITDSDIRPAKTGSIINFVLAAPVLALGTISAVSEDEVAIAFGAAATAVAGIGIPIGAIIPGKTRRNAGVNGSTGLRIAGWISYGLTMADAITMLALSEEVDFTGGPTISVALLGTLSTVFFGLDASKTVRQAKEIQSSVSLQPTIGYVRDMTGNQYRTVGFRIVF
jgi:hypothetical protein